MPRDKLQYFIMRSRTHRTRISPRNRFQEGYQGHKVDGEGGWGGLHLWGRGEPARRGIKAARWTAKEAGADCTYGDAENRREKASRLQGGRRRRQGRTAPMGTRRTGAKSRRATRGPVGAVRPCRQSLVRRNKKESGCESSHPLYHYLFSRTGLEDVKRS